MIVLGDVLCRNVMVGTGVYYHMSGDVYEGEFADNEYQGLGTYRYSDGSFVSGMLMLINPSPLRPHADASCWQDHSRTANCRASLKALKRPPPKTSYRTLFNRKIALYLRTDIVSPGL